MDHHRAEVGHVTGGVPGQVVRDALGLAQLDHLVGEPFAQRVGGRVEDVGAGEVQLQALRLGADEVSVAEQGEPSDLAAEQLVGGDEDPVLLALG